MSHPVRGIREMARVTRPGGIVAANVRDYAGSAGPLAVFWAAVRSIDAQAPDESDLPGVREGQLAALFAEAGLTPWTSTALTVELEHGSFDQWWHPLHGALGMRI
jgi:hypothetical protein